MANSLDYQRNGRRLSNRRIPKSSIVRILLVDSCITFRYGLEQAIIPESDLKVVGSIGRFNEVGTEIFIPDCDVALIDVDLLDKSGVELCQWMISLKPELPVLLLSYWHWDVYLVAAKNAGARGVIYRDANIPSIIQSIRQAMVRPIYTPVELAQIKLWETLVIKRLGSLSPREWQIIWLVAEGLNNKEIAEKFSISVNTAEKHVSGVLQKLGLRSKASLTSYVFNHHLDVLKSLPEHTNFFL